MDAVFLVLTDVQHRRIIVHVLYAVFPARQPMGAHHSLAVVAGSEEV